MNSFNIIYGYRIFLQFVDIIVELVNKVGVLEIINRIVDDLKDENEQYRKMVMEIIEKVFIFYDIYFFKFWLFGQLFFDF